MTSTCSRSAPPRSAAAISWPSAAKSAESSDAAIITVPGIRYRLTSSEIGSPGAIWKPACGFCRRTMPGGDAGIRMIADDCGPEPAGAQHFGGAARR